MLDGNKDRWRRIIQNHHLLKGLAFDIYVPSVMEQNNVWNIDITNVLKGAHLANPTVVL